MLRHWQGWALAGWEIQVGVDVHMDKFLVHLCVNYNLAVNNKEGEIQLNVAGYGSGGGVVGRVGDYAGDRHANESQGPGLAGIQNFGSMRERNDGRNVEETHNEHKSEHKSEDKSTQNRPHNPTLMPGSESICLEGTDTGPCAGPDCGGGMGCHGYGMEDE